MEEQDRADNNRKQKLRKEEKITEMGNYGQKKGQGRQEGFSGGFLSSGTNFY